MLKSVIFDMGNVLILYDPDHFIRRAGIRDEGDKKLLMEAIFASADWPLQDAGQLTEEQLLKRVYPRLPERLHQTAQQLVMAWDDPIIPIPGMEELVRECKEAGLQVYLLSNASVRQSEYWKNIPASRYFDGTVISALVGCIKPAQEIYRHLLERFSLKGEECLFVDDMPQNVEGARRAGMNAVVFDGDVQGLRKTIAAMRERGK